MLFPPAILAASRLYIIPIALALYDTVPAPWQRVDVAPDENTGVPADAVVVTVCVAEVGPLQPVAVAVTIEAPDHPAAKLTSPVEALILFPPAILAASRSYVIPVALVAIAVYNIFIAPWQRVDVVPNANTGVLTSGLSNIVTLPAPELHARVILFCDLT
jgi:hypothetical protein